MGLIPPLGIRKVVKVREFGVNKYSDPTLHGYVDHLNPLDLIEAAERHLNCFRAGEKFDKESGICHLAHAASSLLMTIEIEERKKNE